MSLIITVYTSEGIVMASDSRTTQTFTNRGKTKSFPLSDNAEKTFVTKWNYGISTCGGASIDGFPLSGYIHSFLNSYKYEQDKTNVDCFSKDICDYFVSRSLNDRLIFHVAGYIKNDDLSTRKVLRCVINSDKTYKIEPFSGKNCGALWDGQSEVMLRLIKQHFLSSSFVSANSVNYIDASGSLVNENDVYILPKSQATFIPEASIDFNMMTLQDAVDFARFAVRTTIDTQRFLQMEKTVGGPIDVLVIKPQNSEWISHKGLK